MFMSENICSSALLLSVVPSAPRFFRIQQRHLDSIYVDWDLPAEPNGIITGYSLKYQTGLPIQLLKNKLPNVVLCRPPWNHNKALTTWICFILLKLVKSKS